MKKYILALDQGTTSSRTIVFDKRVSEITDEEKEDYDEGIVSLWGCFEYDRQKLFDEDTACQKLYENRLVDEFFAENKYPWRKTLSILKRIENMQIFTLLLTERKELAIQMLTS